MKIGEFSKVYNLSKETIRYYTDFGLLVPDKIGNYHNYNKRSVEDMNRIIELKGYGFSLNEILKILALLRVSQVNNANNIENISNVMSKKKEELIAMKLDIENKIIDIDKFIKDANKKCKAINNNHGLNLKFVEFMVCPSCKRGVEIHNSKIQGNGITEGSIECICGHNSYIEEGIFVCEDLNNKENSPHNIINKNLSNVNPKLILLLQKTSNYICSEVRSEELENKVILDLNADISLVTRYIVGGLKSSTIYVITGESFEDVKMKRHYLKNIKTFDNILFIVATNNLPIKYSSIDIVIDTYATSFKYMKSTFGIIEKLKYYLKNDGILIGSYFGYKNCEMATKNIGEEVSKYFTIDSLNNYFSFLGFEKCENKIWGKIKDTGYALSFHNHSDLLYIWTYKANIARIK